MVGLTAKQAVAKKAGNKPTRKDDEPLCADRFYPAATLRRTARLLYQNKFNPEPWSSPEPMRELNDTRGITKRVVEILGELPREGVRLEDLQQASCW